MPKKQTIEPVITSESVSETNPTSVKANSCQRKDLELFKAPNTISDVYYVFISAPEKWVDSPLPDTFIAASFINNENFRVLGFYSGTVYIKSVENGRVTVRFSIQSGYLDNFYRAMRSLGDDAQLIKEQERG